MKNSPRLVALCAAILCSQNLWAQSATVSVTDANNQTDYASGGASVTGTTGGAPSITSTVTDGTNTSQVSQTATTYQATVAPSTVYLDNSGVVMLHSNASGTVDSAFVVTDNAATAGTFQSGSGRQYNGTYSVYNAGSSLDITQVGSFDASNTLTYGLQVNGTTGTNLLVGNTFTNGISNAGNLSTTTLTATGASTLAGINNGNGGITNAGAISGVTSLTASGAVTAGSLNVAGASSLNGINNHNAGITNAGAVSGVTVLNVSGLVSGGSLAVSGASSTNGIANTGNIATTTLSTSGNTTVGGNLAVSGTTSTNGIDNNGKVIGNVAPGVASSDAATVGQLTASSANQAAMNASQANTNTRMQLQTAENRQVASTGTAIVAAAAAIPALEAGKNMGFGAGVGTYDGRSAVSVAFAARVSPAAQIKLHLGTGSSGKVAAGAGGMWSW